MSSDKLYIPFWEQTTVSLAGNTESNTDKIAVFFFEVLITNICKRVFRFLSGTLKPVSVFIRAHFLLKTKAKEP